MYAYKISELLESLNQAKKERFEYVELFILDSEEDAPESLELNYLDSNTDSEADSIDAIIVPDNYIRA